MSNKTKRSSINIITITFLILFVAKVFGFSDMSWWWVFSPFLFGLCIVGILVLAVLMVGTYRKEDGNHI